MQGEISKFPKIKRITIEVKFCYTGGNQDFLRSSNDLGLED